MRMSDWSSDVCSSDLGESTPPGASEPSHFKIVEGLGIFALMRAEMHTLLARSPLPLTGVISDFVALLSVQPAAPPSGAYFIYFSATRISTGSRPASMGSRPRSLE